LFSRSGEQSSIFGHHCLKSFELAALRPLFEDEQALFRCFVKGAFGVDGARLPVQDDAIEQAPPELGRAGDEQKVARMERDDRRTLDVEEALLRSRAVFQERAAPL